MTRIAQDESPPDKTVLYYKYILYFLACAEKPPCENFL